MRKHPINKHVRSPRPTQHELENPKTRHRALVRMGRHRNMVKGVANRQDPHDGPNRVAVPHYSDLTISREATPEDYALFAKLFPGPRAALDDALSTVEGS